MNFPLSIALLCVQLNAVNRANRRNTEDLIAGWEKNITCADIYQRHPSPFFDHQHARLLLYQAPANALLHEQ